MRFVWDERKRRTNLRDHKLDFLDAPQVFAGPTVTYEDDRFAYGEQRFVTLGFLNGVAVSIQGEFVLGRKIKIVKENSISSEHLAANPV